jgi:Porin subfamily
MKLVKSLMLGSAAGLIAMSGAQAADLPVKAKAVEYVKICSLYGAGFYYIPGTDTCLKLGGYLRADLLFNTTSDAGPAASGVAGAENRFSNYYIFRSREDFNIDTRTATEYGVVRTFADITWTWTSGSYSGIPSVYSTIPAAPSNDLVAGGSLGVYYAFIQFAGFTLGKAISQFSTPWTNYPANNFDTLVGGGGTVTGVNQFTYTADFGQGISASFSAQDPSLYFQSNLWNTSIATAAGILGGNFGGSAFGGTRSPDWVAMVRVDQAWGLFQASFAAHDNTATYFSTPATIPFGELNGHPDDKWGWAGQLALSIKNIPTGPGDTINIQGVYTSGASRYNFQDLTNINYAMYGGSGFAYQSLGIAGVTDAVYGTGTSQQLTQTWGFRGGYTHNWDPYWTTAIYGAWGQVSYNSTAKGLICTSAAAISLGFGTTASCNPDFSVAQAGLKVGWTPVKNLTFSGDVLYTALDQKNSGFISGPGTAVASIGKPAATYELKDQSTWTFLFRAQRNW